MVLIAASWELRAALAGLVESHAGLVNSGDCGFWKVEDEPAMLAARAALAKAEGRGCS